MRNHLIKLSRSLELMFFIAFMVISAVMFMSHKVYLGVLYFVLAAMLSPLPVVRRLPSGVRFWVVIIGVFL